MIPDDVIEQVRERADVLEIVGEVVHLKRAGATYKGLCPFHGEKTPSFTVNPHQGTYHCFGCQAHGDSLKFIRETQHLNFPEAVRALAARVGVVIPEDRSVSPQQRRARAQKRALEDRLLDTQELLTVWYEQCLSRSQAAQTYLRQRQISPESARTFRLGWAMNDVGATVRWMHQNEVSLCDLEALGVVVPHDPQSGRKPGDSRLNGGRLRFRDRLMCPIFDLRDRVLGFSGRVIDPQQKIAKYLNSPETPLFTKGNCLFGLKTARVAMTRSQRSDLILCEGNLDVIALWQAGFPNAVAAMGTAITESQAILLKRLTQSVICVMDGDAAGQKAAFKSLPILLSKGLDVRGRALPNGHDPDSFIKEHGGDSFRGWLNQSQPLILERMRVLLDEHPRDPIGQAKVARELIDLVKRVESEEQRPLFLDVIARELGVHRSYLSDLLLQEERPRAVLGRDGERGRATSQEARAQTSQRAQHHPDRQTSSESHFHDSATEPRDEGGFPQKFKARHEEGKSRGEAQRERPWWTQVSIERGGGRVKARRFGERPTGEAQLKLDEPPRPPSQLHLTSQQPVDDEAYDQLMGSRLSLTGYEREAVSFLFYHPELIERFLESEGGELFAYSEVKSFLMSLKSERDQGLFVSGELYLSQSQDRDLVAILRDCIASPPPLEEKISSERKLGDLIHRLKRGKLQADLTRVSNELRALACSPEELSLSVEELQNAREQMIHAYQEIQANLNALGARVTRSS